MSIDELHKLWDKRNGGKAAPSEHSLQTACVNWFRLAYPLGIIYAVPNGAWCGYKQGRKLVSEGLVSGVPDLVIPIARKGWHALYIEMKNGKQGRVSDNQSEMMKKLVREGNMCAVCRNFDQFRQIITDYFG